MNSNILHETFNQNKVKESTFHPQGVQKENINPDELRQITIGKTSEEFMAEGIFVYGTLMTEEFLFWDLIDFFDNVATYSLASTTCYFILVSSCRCQQW
jgi:hypothetical protein